MKLIYDCGNSRLKIALVKNTGSIVFESFSYDHFGYSGISQFLGNIRNVDIWHIGAAGVNPSINKVISITRKHIKASPIFLKSSAKTSGVRNAYTAATSLGVDRWAAIVYACNKHPGPLVVIDCGTAITADFVDGSRNHIGGAIFPGLPLWSKALSNVSTLNISLINDGTEANKPGLNTSECIQFGMASYIEGISSICLNKAIELMGNVKSVVMTGGDGNALRKYDDRFIYEKEAVLRGLDILGTGDDDVKDDKL